jgi:hypothetical protein
MLKLFPSLGFLSFNSLPQLYYELFAAIKLNQATETKVGEKIKT